MLLNYIIILQGKNSMKKKSILLLIIAVFIGIPFIVTEIQHFKMNKDFNNDCIEYFYDYANAYVEATQEIQGLNKSEKIEYMKRHNLEHYIEKLHNIIDERIISLKKWEKKFNTVYVEPFEDIGNVIALEHIYNLSKSGFYEMLEIESDEWYSNGLLFITVDICADNAPIQRDEWRKYIDAGGNTSIVSGFTRDENDIKDYHNASLNWRSLEKNAKAFLDDPNISASKKTWVYNYIQSDPYGEQKRKLDKYKHIY
jgi:hypothetical protein